MAQTKTQWGKYVEKETGRRYEIILRCDCGYAIEKSHVTKNWKRCPLCGGELKTKKAYFD